MTKHITTAKKTKIDSPLTIIVPAATPGNRMKGKGAISLFELNHGTTLIEHQLRILTKVYPHADIIYCIGFDAVHIIKKVRKNFPIRFVINENYSITNIMHSIALAYMATLPSNLLIIMGDLYFNTYAINDMVDVSKMLVDTNSTIGKYEVGLVVDNHEHITNMSYGVDQKWGQVVHLTGNELALFAAMMENYINHSYKFIHECLNTIIKRGGVFIAYQQSKAKIINIDTQESLTKAKQL